VTLIARAKALEVVQHAKQAVIAVDVLQVVIQQKEFMT